MLHQAPHKKSPTAACVCGPSFVLHTCVAQSPSLVMQPAIAMVLSVASAESLVVLLQSPLCAFLILAVGMVETARVLPCQLSSSIATQAALFVR
jgi:hypothetical protein